MDKGTRNSSPDLGMRRLKQSSPQLATSRSYDCVAAGRELAGYLGLHVRTPFGLCQKPVKASFQ